MSVEGRVRFVQAAHQLRIEFSQSRLSIVIEDKDRIDHRDSLYRGRGTGNKDELEEARL